MTKTTLNNKNLIVLSIVTTMFFIMALSGTASAVTESGWLFDSLGNKIMSLVDGYSCGVDYCVYHPWYSPTETYIKDGRTQGVSTSSDIGVSINSLTSSAVSILIKNGTYSYSTEINLNTGSSIFGDGTHPTLNYTGTGNAITINGTSNYVSGVKISGLVLQSPTGTAGRGINISCTAPNVVTKSEVSDNYFNNFSTSIEDSSTACYKNYFSHNHISNNRYVGIYSRGAYNYYSDNEVLSISTSNSSIYSVVDTGTSNFWSGISADNQMYLVGQNNYYAQMTVEGETQALSDENRVFYIAGYGNLVENPISTTSSANYTFMILGSGNTIINPRTYGTNNYTNIIQGSNTIGDGQSENITVITPNFILNSTTFPITNATSKGWAIIGNGGMYVNGTWQTL